MTPTRVVRPGSWYAVLGSRAVVLLPPSEKSRVPAVWSLVDDGAGFDEVLDALIADGLRELSGFALVSVDDDGDARLVMRGGVSAELFGRDGLARVSGATAATWFEREVRQVNGFRVTVDDEWAEDADADDAVRHCLGDGIARASGVDEPAIATPLAAPAAEPAPEPDPEPEPEAHPRPGPEEVPTQHVPEQALTGPDTGPDTGPGTGPVARLLLSNGETVAVDRPVLLGRAPDASAAEVPDPHLVALPSPSREISGTHLEIRPGEGPDLGAAVATDLGSTNGTVLVQPGGDREELRAGTGVPLEPGAVLDLGDGISIEVVEP